MGELSIYALTTGSLVDDVSTAGIFKVNQEDSCIWVEVVWITMEHLSETNRTSNHVGLPLERVNLL
jgi:hypothetical protein